MLQILLSKGRELFLDDKIPYIELLKQANKEGFTPLLSSLVEGTPDNVQLYFNQLEKVFNLSDPDDKKEYQTYLTQANSAGFTPLLSSLVEGTPDNVQLYFNQLEKVFNLSNPVDKKEYIILYKRIKKALPHF